MSTRNDEPSQDLNLVPVMNLVTILIPFLLMSAEFVSLAVVDTTLPSICGPGCDETVMKDPKDGPALNLTIAVTDAGYTITGNELGITDDDKMVVPCPGNNCASNGYDNAELNRVLAEIKRSHPSEENLVIVPSSDTDYGTLIGAMDGSRRNGEDDLFPYVIIAGGAQ